MTPILWAFLLYGAYGNNLENCKKYNLDFNLLAGDPLMAQIEDDIRGDLAKLGFTVNTRLLSKPDFNAGMQQGNFSLCFTETWGPPYDPHSFATGWFRPDNEAHYPALDGMEPPMTKSILQTMVSDVVKKKTELARQQGWTAILQEMHKQAISLPMWSRRMPAVWNRRLANYRAGEQQFDYPMHNLLVVSGSNTVNVAPGAQTGLFVTTGPMDPHSYRPNEFFISNWMYEGLVSYGPDGTILPHLATRWTASDTADGGQEYTFTLRSGVTFHDGAAWNCAAAKMNFDHVLQPPLNDLNFHGWYHLAKHTKSWRCDSPSSFVIKLAAPYYPFLQELSLIRPLRMLSPNSFKSGPSTDPKTENSCPLKWSPSVGGTTITCVGVRSFIGTGPWKFNQKVLRPDGSIKELIFDRNPTWWGTHGDVQKIVVKQYANSANVKAALLSGELDMVVGGGVLTPNTVKEFQTQHQNTFQTKLGPPLMNTIIVLNAARPPTNDIAVRRLIIHAINKAAIVNTEMSGIEQVADSLFPKDAPYCNVDLTPRWDYDFEKARLMNCPVKTITTTASQEESDNTILIAGLVLGIGVPCIALAGLAFWFGRRKGYSDLESQMLEKQKAQKAKEMSDTVGIPNSTV